MEIIFRQAEEKDTEQLIKLMRYYIVDFYNKPEPNQQELQSLIERLRSNSDFGTQFVAENIESGDLLGFATLYYTFSTLSLKRATILNDLFVSSDARGHKVGERLFSTCLSFIRENGHAYMTWETAKDNHIAQSLYNKMGGELSEWLVYSIS